MTLLVFLTLALIGASGPTFLKFTLNEYSPLVLTSIRAFLSMLIILPLIYKEKLIPTSKNIKFLIVSNLLFATNWLAFALGLNQTSIIMGQIEYLPTAVVVAILGYIFLKEKLNRYQVLGCLLILLGMTPLLYGSIKSQDILSFGKPIGNLTVLVGLFSWSTYLIVSRKISNIYTPKVIVFYNFLVTFVLSLPIVYLSGELNSLSLGKISANTHLSLLGLSFLSSVVFFLLFQTLIKRTSAFISSLVIYPVAITSALSGVLFFSERLEPTLILGAAFVLLGLFMATSYTYVKKYIKL